MYINDDIEYLHKIIIGVKNGSIIDFGVFDRLFAIGIISIFNRINSELEELYKELELSPNLEALSIKFDTFLDENYWFDNQLLANKYNMYEAVGVNYSEISFTSDINCMTDYLPPVGKNGFTQDQVDSFKRALHQLCDEEKLSYRCIQQGVLEGLLYMLGLLGKIKEKVANPASHQYVKIWNEIYEEYKDSKCIKDYNEWIEGIENPTFDDLLNRQKQEIFNLLCSGFFRYSNTPFGYQLKRNSFRISEDDLPVGVEIPKDLNINIAKFDRYINWKGKYILVFDYEALGKYIYRNYHKFSKEELYAIVDFDMVLDKIHGDMIKFKPQLEQYLKGNEEKNVKQLIKDCIEILNSCEDHLAKGFHKSFLKYYLEKLLYDKEMKNEARKKLSGGSRNTYICEIVAALMNVHVFRPEIDKNILAKSLSEKIRDIKVTSIAKNIERSYNANEGAVLYWTQKNINDMKIRSCNPFKDLTSLKE